MSDINLSAHYVTTILWITESYHESAAMKGLINACNRVKSCIVMPITVEDRDQLRIARFMYSNQKKQDLTYCVPHNVFEKGAYRVRITSIVRAPTKEKAAEVFMLRLALPSVGKDYDVTVFNPDDKWEHLYNVRIDEDARGKYVAITGSRKRVYLFDSQGNS